MDTSKIISLLGEQSEFLLGHTCKTIDKSLIHIPSPSVIDSIWIGSDRNIQTLNNLQRLLGSGRLANTGYVSILPVDQDIEHTAGASTLRTRSISIRKTSSGWLLKEDVTE